MRAPLEKDFQKNALRRLRRIPYSKWFKIRDNTTVGIPDILGVLCGLFVSIELKTRSELEPMQEYTLLQIESSYGLAFVCDDITFPFVAEYLEKIGSKKGEITVATQRSLPLREENISLACLLAQTKTNRLLRRREADKRARERERNHKRKAKQKGQPTPSQKESAQSPIARKKGSKWREV